MRSSTVVLATTPVDEIPDEMIRLANEAGGKDNITVIVIEVPKDYQPYRKSPRGSRIPRNILFPLVGVGVLAVLAIILALILGFGILSFGGESSYLNAGSSLYRISNRGTRGPQSNCGYSDNQCCGGNRARHDHYAAYRNTHSGNHQPGNAGAGNRRRRGRPDNDTLANEHSGADRDGAKAGRDLLEINNRAAAGY